MASDAPIPVAQAPLNAPSSAVGVVTSGRWRDLDPLRLTAWSLMVNTVTTSGLGMLFWGQASRVYPVQQVGQDAALISAMMLLSTVSQLNLSMGIPRLLPQVRERRWYPVVSAYGLTAGVGVVVTACFVVVAPRLSGEFAFLGRNVELALALVAAVVLWNVFALQDAALTSARWAVAVPVENGIFGLLKIVLMVWLAGELGSHGIFFAWLLAMALLLAPVNALLFGKALRSRAPAEVRPSTALPIQERGRIARYLAADYVAALLSQGYSALLPLIVIAVLGRAANAYFYVSFLIVAAVGALAQSLSISLVVEGAHDETSLSDFTRRSLRRYSMFVLPAVIVMVAAAPLVLGFFGDEYATRGTGVLRLLLLGTVPQAFVTLYLGVERVRADVRRVLAVEAVTLVLVAAGAVFGMRSHGLIGVGLAWLLAQSAVALVVVRPVWRLVSGQRAGAR